MKKETTANFLLVKARDFAEEITNFNVKKKHLRGKKQIIDEHATNYKNVLQLLIKNEIYPEKLPQRKKLKSRGTTQF